MRPQIVLIDGSNAAHRFKHTYSELGIDNKDGTFTNTGVQYGFMRMLDTLMEEFNPNCIIVALDAPSYWRTDVFPTYKEGRRKKSDVYTQEEQDAADAFHTSDVPRSVDMMRRLGIPCLLAHKLEADDVIASLVYRNKVNSDLVIVSTDKDFLQLVEPAVRVFNPITHKITYYDKQMGGVIEGNTLLAPSGRTFLLRKTIVGDPSDSIQGVSGIGKVTVCNFISEEWLPTESYAAYKERVGSDWADSKRGKALLDADATIYSNLMVMDLGFQYSRLKMPPNLQVHEKVNYELSKACGSFNAGRSCSRDILLVDKKFAADPSPFLTYFRRIEFQFANNPADAKSVKTKFYYQMCAMLKMREEQTLV